MIADQWQCDSVQIKAINLPAVSIAGR